MILEVLSHCWQVHDCVNTDRLVQAACSNTRDLKNLRRVNGASSQNSFAIDGHRRLLAVRGCCELC